MEDDDELLELEISALCCDEDLIGFDKNTGSTWIYPTNYPVRDYQFNIIKSALFSNTLVSLPTGLGKTFIAAVIMYNFYRWYPMGKIIFVAPTRPLVAQQIEACYNIMAIPAEDTIEITGTTQINARKIAWQQKRVFFATPQVVQNDLESGACPGELVRCLVIDEAHRAKGRHSYCQLIGSLLSKGHRLFRILALSATPGSKVDDVLNIVRNLKISHLELRSEECIDVAMFSHSRKIQTIVVSLGKELSAIMQQFIEILDVYARRLVQYKVLTGNIGGLSKGRIVMLFKEFQNREKSLRHPQHKIIMYDFTILITLYHALELLTKHGARVFLNFFDEHTDKKWVEKDDCLTAFLERLRDDLGTNPMSIDINTLPDGTIPEIKEELKYGHPKFEYLKNVIMEHFNKANQETKAIVFCEYRESVNLVHRLLLQCRPLIKSQIFIGQGVTGNGFRAFSQKQQLRVMKSFREGSCNVLVSTCIGEEGLDVGSVDLIVCFDISTKSPIRLVQRCGRTGRERKGHVVMLVTEGREHQTLRECMHQRDTLNKKILQSKELQGCLYVANPRMLPPNLTPECCKMFITVKKKTDENKNSLQKKVQTKISNIFMKKRNAVTSDLPIERNIAQDIRSNNELCNNQNENTSDTFFQNDMELWSLTEEQFKSLCNSSDNSYENGLLNPSRWIEWQRHLQYTANIEHSIDTHMFCELLQYADSKRFGLPFKNKVVCSQINSKPNMKLNFNKKILKNVQSSNKDRNNDIRSLFSNMNKLKNKEAHFNEKYKELLSKYGVDVSNDEAISNYLKINNISQQLINFIVQLDMDTANEKSHNEDRFNFNVYDKLFFNKNNTVCCDTPFNIVVPNISCLNDLSLNVLKTFDITKYVGNNNLNIPTTKNVIEKEKNFNGENNLDLVDIDTIFEDSVSFNSSPKNNELKNIEFMPNENVDVQDTLGFFGLNSIEDIFAEDFFDEDKINSNTEKNRNVESDIDSLENEPVSPILCSQRNRKRDFSKLNKCSNSKSRLSVLNNSTHTETKIQKNIINNSLDVPLNSTNKVCHNDSSLLTVSQIIDIFQNNKDNIDKGCNNGPKNLSLSQKISNNSHISMNKNDNNHDKHFTASTSLLKKKNVKSKPNIVILNSSDSDHSDFETKADETLDSKKNGSMLSAKKRVLDSDDEYSPFFNKVVKLDISPTLLRKSRNLQIKSPEDKLYVLSDNLNNSYNTDEDFCKENINTNTANNASTNVLSIHDLNDFVNQPKLQLYRSSQKRENENVYENNTSDHKNNITNGVHQTPDTVKYKNHKKRRKKTHKNNLLCEFIDYEAILSDDSYEDSDDGASQENLDLDLSSFICDEVEEVEVDMKAKYLQSVRSPQKTTGIFKIPLAKSNDENVFSQLDVKQDDNYELDSFCIDNDIDLTQHHEMSELEIAEAVLKKRKRRRVKENRTIVPTKSDSTDSFSVIDFKRKRNRLRINSDSSSDEDAFR